jgi:hypothetical protein
MPWIRIDDHYDEHPKFARAGPLGVVMWLAGLAYCNRNLTDGFIPWSVARSLVSWEFLRPAQDDATRELIWTVALGTGMHGEDVACPLVIDLLVDAGLWDEVDGGYRVHDYADFQPTRASVIAERAKKVAAGQAGGLAAAKARAKARRTPRAKASAAAESKPNPVPVSVSQGLTNGAESEEPRPLRALGAAGKP